MNKLLIGVNSYNDLSLLKESLPPLEKLRRDVPAQVVLLDTAWNEEVQRFVQKEFPHFSYLRHPEGNIGYGRSYSEILRHFPHHKYFLVVTSDVLLNNAVVQEFIRRMEKDATITLCAGKAYHWDIKNSRKTNIIDSLGIVAERRHHFYDRGHGEVDKGQYDEVLNDIFGISGAVFLIRTSVIPKLFSAQPSASRRKETPPTATFLDPRMWMYKEDIDLSYRLRWMGETIKIFPEVWAWHGRTVANKEGQSLRALSQADQKKRDYARLHSYKNHLLLLKNHFTWRYGLRTTVAMLFYEFLKAIYMLFCHPRVFFAGIKTLLFIPGWHSPRLSSPQEMLSHFE